MTDMTFHVVFTPRTFDRLAPFTRTLVDDPAAAVRVVANCCDADEIERMRRFAAAHVRVDDDVVVINDPSRAMVPHGEVLDTLFERSAERDFAFVDSDVFARAGFVGEIRRRRRDHALVTTGDVAWADDDRLPAGSIDLVGRHAIGHDGFHYGSSYVACYDRGAVEEVRARHGTTFRTAVHEQLPAAIRGRLADLGRTFRRYDTAKVLNLLLVADGHRIEHFTHPALFHLGGISDFLSYPGSAAPNPTRPWYATTGTGATRWAFARFAAAALDDLAHGRPPETDPSGALGAAATPQQRVIAERVLSALAELVARSPTA
jgi:hypothetical protein